MEQPARYFDLVNKPETLKRINGNSITDSELKNIPNDGDSIPKDWDVSFGDVLNWSEERPTEAFFVLEDRTLLKNPDLSGSGYLTIPSNVTKNCRNVFLRYEYVIKGIGKNYVSSIEINPQDVFIEKNWGQIPSEMLSQHLEFIYDLVEEFLYVKIPTTKKSKGFQLGSTTVNDIHIWLNCALEEQALFHIKYNFTGLQFQKYHNEYRLQHEHFSIPKSWSVEPGTTEIGHDYCRGEWIFHGDRKQLNQVKKSVQDFYKELPITIEDIHEK